MNKVMSLALVSVLGLFAQPVLAAGKSYECKIVNTRSQGNWLPKVLFIGHDETKDTVIVSDPIILYFNDRQPIQGHVSTDNNKRTTFTWKLKTKTKQQYATIAYRATYMKATGRLNISGSPLGYSNRYTSSGTCEVKPLK
ncbi:MAG: hypothetical protein ACRBB0_01930 [Pelagimonas sp.]|uniref:hypothetical protein n=1 Tax=Pelagimonas sp. TaxID=2073170 RepID=UPI003D6C4396